jgi:hypothetical protein
VAEPGDPKQRAPAAARGRRGLPLARPGQAQLEQPTIMNRVLAAQYGAAYVQLVVFAIDVDRVYVESEAEGAALAFGWEVFLTECHLLGRVARDDAAQLALLEDTCIAILEQEPDEQGYGSQLLFATHDAIERGLLPSELASVFSSWRKHPKQLSKALSALWNEPASALAQLAGHCLAQALEPPLAAPTREALMAMQARRWPLPQRARSES